MFKLGFGRAFSCVRGLPHLPMGDPQDPADIGRLWGRLRKFAAQFRDYADDMDLPTFPSGR
jgi:hypothetical protein